jgi:hypothetical protein
MKILLEFKNYFNKNNLVIFSFIFLIVISGVFYRLYNTVPNFSPIAAIALYSGFLFRKRFSFLIPILIMLVSDFLIGFYYLPIMLSVYLSLVIVNLIGFLIKNRVSYFTVTISAFLSSLLFFMITNFSVWFFGNWYQPNLEGFIQCFTNALPFFRNTLVSNLFFSSIFFVMLKVFYYLEKNALITKFQIIQKYEK